MNSGRRRQSGIQTYDLGIGFFGFFAVAFFVISLSFQITGMDPIWASASALVSLALVGILWYFRRRFILRSKDDA
jgi:hypothetical protein